MSVQDTILEAQIIWWDLSLDEKLNTSQLDIIKGLLPKDYGKKKAKEQKMQKDTKQLTLQKPKKKRGKRQPKLQYGIEHFLGG